jgi:arsenical pump membrane protein
MRRTARDIVGLQIIVRPAPYNRREYVRTAILGAALLLLGGVAIATGILPTVDALAIGARVWPILLFVVAITVVTELAAEARLFRLVVRTQPEGGVDPVR